MANGISRGRRSARASSAGSNPPPAQTSQATATGGHSSHPGIVLILVGAAFFALFTVTLMTQVQTNEAFITNAGNVNVYKPNWAILMQIPNLVGGTLPTSEAASTLFGWGIELIYLGFIIGYELLHESIQGQFMANLFRNASWAIVLFNGWTDFTYGTLGGGFWGHFGFAIITSFIVGFFGTIGISLMRHGWSRI